VGREPNNKGSSSARARPWNSVSAGSFANSSDFQKIAATHPPDTFCAVYGRAQCITTTRFDGHHPTDKIQRISVPPGGPEIRQQHRRRSQRRIWGQELAPSRPQPPTGGTDGIQPAAGSPTTPGWCRSAHARAGVVVLGLVCRSPVLIFLAAPYHRNTGFWTTARENGIRTSPPRVAVNQDVTNHPVCSKIVASLFNICWLCILHIHATSSPLGMRCAPVVALGTGSEVGNLRCRHRESGSRWLAYILTR
jgi:hypothetical protein